MISDEEFEFHNNSALWHIENTIPRLRAHRAEPFPIRGSLPNDDGVLIEELNNAKAMHRGKDDYDENSILRQFGRWRGAVLMAEQKISGTITFLLRMLYHLDISTIPESFEAAKQVRSWLQQEFGLNVTEMTGNEEQIREISYACARRMGRKHLSDYLLANGKEEYKPQTDHVRHQVSIIFKREGPKDGKEIVEKEI